MPPVKGGVEARDLQQMRTPCWHGAYWSQVVGLMQRRQRRPVRSSVAITCDVIATGSAVRCAAVHDAVADGVRQVATDLRP